MDRAYVICHMAVSLDGKIDGDFHEAEKSEKAGAFYFAEAKPLEGGAVHMRLIKEQ